MLPGKHDYYSIILVVSFEGLNFVFLEAKTILWVNIFVVYSPLFI